MKTTLFAKIFITFVVTSVMVVVLMVGIMRFYVARNFTDYVNHTALERLGELRDELAAVYQAHQGWQRLQDNSSLWEEILRSSVPPVRSRERLSRYARGLALFDAHKQHVVGSQRGLSFEGYTAAEISVDGKTVGWLGLYKKEHLKNPLVVAFLKQQSQAFYLVGGPILLLAAMVAFFLSKHFLAPIKQLTAGTRALSLRRFDTRIAVQSKDELGQLAVDFNTMARTLEKYETMRRQWISDISHELRTPLSVLRGELEALQDGIREMNRETLDSLHAEVLHVGKIVNDLHELSLAETGALAFKKEPVDPLHVLKNTLRSFQTRLEQQNIDVRAELESADPVRIMGDPDRLTQLFSNLLENTLRYVNAPGILRIMQIRSGGRLTIFMEDSGPGVPEASLEHLFDRLYRVDKSRSRARGGSGLGLSICKSIVDNLGGTIRAENAPSGGLRIEMAFPMISPC